MSAHDPAAVSRQAARTRSLIRQAFLDLLFEHAYASVTMAAVAERADVGRSTLYEHYRTKDELFRDVARMPMSGLAELVGAAAIAPSFGDLLQHFRDNRALGRVLVHLPAYASMQRVLA